MSPEGAVQSAWMRTNTPSYLPSLDADSPLRVAINKRADDVLAVAALMFFPGAIAALVLGCIAGVSGTKLLDLPIAIASALFCLSMPILLVAAFVGHYSAPRQFRYAERWLARTIAALRAGDLDAREQLLLWAAEHPLRVRAALRKAYHPDLLPMLLPLVQATNPAHRRLAHILLDLAQPTVLPALLPLLEGRRRRQYLKQRMRAQPDYEAAFIAAYVLGPLRAWNGPAYPPPDPNLLRALLLYWPALASDDDLRRALLLPDFSCDVRWLNGRGELETRQRPRAYVAVREAAAHVARARGLPQT